ncbi:hypothetical protein BC830DRAFT_1169247 [Chytriomyces sp. MP71]|nr:hypothetical protein BC830DRAFT_1169247 [Chytriomyces sp. MP71]
MASVRQGDEGARLEVAAVFRLPKPAFSDDGGTWCCYTFIIQLAFVEAQGQLMTYESAIACKASWWLVQLDVQGYRYSLAACGLTPIPKCPKAPHAGPCTHQPIFHTMAKWCAPFKFAFVFARLGVPERFVYVPGGEGCVHDESFHVSGFRI